MKQFLLPALGLILGGTFTFTSFAKINENKPIKIPSTPLYYAAELAQSDTQLLLQEKELDKLAKKLNWTQRVLIQERAKQRKIKTTLISSEFLNNSAKASIYQPNQDNSKLVQSVTKLIAKYQSPISPDRWVELSQELNFPLNFLLASAHFESHFGTRGRAVKTKNIYNIGNTDGGDYKPVAHDKYNSFNDDFESGIINFASLIRNCYFYENEEIDLKTFIKRDFRAVRCSQKGKRYMSDRLAKIKYFWLANKQYKF